VRNHPAGFFAKFGESLEGRVRGSLVAKMQVPQRKISSK
jgi:hypothetical protein